MSERRSVSAEELAEQINVGEIDTVLVVFPDLQGRLIGKRTNARFYLEHVANGEGTENCNYLIATDMENVPVPGYRFASYDLGYGDMVAMPDEEHHPRHAVAAQDGAGPRRPPRRRHA